jgi:hypothetical protein
MKHSVELMNCPAASGRGINERNPEKPSPQSGGVFDPLGINSYGKTSNWRAITLTKVISQSIQFLSDSRARDALIEQESPVEEDIEAPEF